jgi:phosphoglycerate dehydrogenase-like enzyme
MTTIVVRDPYAEKEVIRLSKEFPGCEFILAAPDGSLPEDVWPRAEILYGEHISPHELALAVRLRWIHVPVSSVKLLCLAQIEERGSILVSATISEGSEAVADFVMGSILAFSKNLLGWYEATRNQNVYEIPTFEQSAWKLEGCTLLQVGLSPVGGAIARRALTMGLKVWGVQEIFTFHADCQKLFRYSELRDLLPAADIICMCPPSWTHLRQWLTPEMVAHIEEDTILIIIGGPLIFKEEDFAALSAAQHLRGLLIDATIDPTPSLSSPLWDIPNLILSPSVSDAPYDLKEASLKLFRKNLRRFIHGEYYSMTRIVSGQETLSSVSQPDSE